jgi:4-hydroxybenzoate polyprenyltransferase
MTAALVMAHAGHWIAGLLYLAPVVVVVAALWRQSWKDKRRDDEDPEDEEGDLPDGLAGR